MFSKRLSYYAAAGLFVGLLLMSIEAIDRSLVLHQLFHGTTERINFYLALTTIPAITIIIALLISLLCALNEAIFARLQPRAPVFWQQLPVGAFIVSLPIWLLAVFAPSIFSAGFHELLVGLNERIANISFANHSTIILFVAIYLIALALVWFDSEIFARLAAKSWFAIPVAIVMFNVTLLFYWADSRLFVGRYFYSFHVPATIAATAAGALVGFIVAHHLKTQSRLIAVISLIVFVAASIGLLRFESNQAAKALFWRRGVIGRKYLALAQNIIDLDRDGFSPLMGGGDCNDLDRNVNVMAREVVNGRDDNCLGSEAAAPPKSYTDLNLQPLDAAPVKNVLFITVDCLRADHLGCYNYPRKITPNIDKFAAQSIVFENAFSLGTNTGHSFSSIARSNHGEAIFDDQIPTIAETFAANNHSTSAITSPKTNEWLQKQGWETYKTIMLKGVQTIVHNDGGNWNSKKLTDHAINYLELQHEKPFYIWIHYNDLHAKNEKYKKLGKHDFGTAPVDLYDANLAFTDDHLGRLFEYLESSKYLENTLVVLSADHGEEFLEHGQQFHNGRPYRVQTNVPMILWYPGVKATRISQPVSSIDLAPTFLRAAGIMPSREYAGLDMKQTIAGRANGRQIFIETPRNVPQGDSFAWAIVDGDWRFIYDVIGNTFELYNGKDDPAEQQNLIDSSPAQANAMKAALNQWLDAESQHKGYRYWARF